MWQVFFLLFSEAWDTSILLRYEKGDLRFHLVFSVQSHKYSEVSQKYRGSWSINFDLVSYQPDLHSAPSIPTTCTMVTSKWGKRVSKISALEQNLTAQLWASTREPPIDLVRFQWDPGPDLAAILDLISAGWSFRHIRLHGDGQYPNAHYSDCCQWYKVLMPISVSNIFLLQKKYRVWASGLS